MKSNKKRLSRPDPHAWRVGRKMVKFSITTRVEMLLNKDYGNLSRAIGEILAQCVEENTLLPEFFTIRPIPAVKKIEENPKPGDHFVNRQVWFTPQELADLKRISAGLGLNHRQGLHLALNWDAQHAPVKDDDDNEGEEWKAGPA